MMHESNTHEEMPDEGRGTPGEMEEEFDEDEEEFDEDEEDEDDLEDDD